MNGGEENYLEVQLLTPDDTLWYHQDQEQHCTHSKMFNRSKDLRSSTITKILFGVVVAVTGEPRPPSRLWFHSLLDVIPNKGNTIIRRLLIVTEANSMTRGHAFNNQIRMHVALNFEHRRRVGNRTCLCLPTSEYRNSTTNRDMKHTNVPHMLIRD